MDRADEVGCAALMVTVDVPVMGRRLRDVRNSFVLPEDVVAANLVDAVSEAHVGVPGLSAVAAHTASAFEPSLSFRDIEWLRARCEIPLVVKGILDPRDARRAVEVGAAGIVVSNHGGRQLDGAVASIAANLRAITDGLAARFPGGEVTWTVPSGGFFVVVTVPFAVDDALLEKSAQEYGVLWTPIGHFYGGDAPVHALWLSCSSVTPAQLDAALNRLAALITDQL